MPVAAAERQRAAPAAGRQRNRGRRGTPAGRLSSTSSTRMMCGVSVRMMSVCCVVSVRECANSRPTTGRSLSPGIPSSDAPLVVADEAGQHVGFAVPQPNHRVDLAIAERRQPAEARRRKCSDRHLQRQRHVVVVMRARRDVDVHADVLVVERGDRLLRRAAGGDRRERRDRDRHALAESRLRRRCLPRCAAAGWPASACWCRS